MDNINNNFKEVFTTIYRDKEWGVSQNYNTSGTGDLISNLPFLLFLEMFLEKTKINSLLDFGCGDWSILKHVKLPSNLNYIGVDVVDLVVQSNNQKFGINENIKFYTIDNDYSQLLDNNKFAAEVLLVKNIFENQPLDHIASFIKHIVSKFKYVIFATFYNPRGQNLDVPIGWYHTLNILDFEFPEGNKAKFLFASEVFDSTFNAYYICGKNLDDDNNLIINLNAIVTTLKELKSRLVIDSLEYLDEHINQNPELTYYTHTINNIRKKYSIDKFIWGNNNKIFFEKAKESMKLIIASFEYAEFISVKGFGKSFKIEFKGEGLYEISFNNSMDKLFLYSFNRDIEKLMPYLLKSHLFRFD